MSERDVISWNSLLSGYVRLGQMTRARALFEEIPNKTIVSWTDGFRAYENRVLPGCFGYFPANGNTGFGSCLTAGLANNGKARKAVELCSRDAKSKGSSQKKEDADESGLKSLGSLLSSYTAHCNLEIAITARERLSELEPEDAGNYVLISNIHADLGKWEDVSRMRKLIRSKRTKRTPGCSSIEVNNVVMEFVACDDLKPFVKDIFHARAARF
ncbi:pentatricopeptide repeat-containing protein At2g20540-like [Pyrus x bretschneideri]|uniref:pentatricopeptide repeat-containing protein At2g20540-like n=1 Tax=Pyrus x bretschneideri TaxID=225117 RepID=UPI00202E0675|nr:pentatricopeptide repeat-containing protein At2g20540-like [Pyrus x bretschneideri]